MDPMSLGSDVQFSLEYDKVVNHRSFYLKYSIDEEARNLQGILIGYIEGLKDTIKEKPECTYLYTALIGYLNHAMSFVSELMSQINNIETSKASDTKFFT